MRIEKLIKIPNENGCTNIGGCAIGGNSSKVFVIKTKQDNRVSTIYQYDAGLKLQRTKKYTDKLGHGNGLAYGSGFLAVPPCGEYLTLIRVNRWERKEYKSERYISAVAYKGDGAWLVKSGKKILEARPDDRTESLHFWDAYTLKNPLEGDGFTVSQDIAFKQDKLYCIYSHESKKQNCIVVHALRGGELVPVNAYLSKRSDSLYEWESLDVEHDENFLIAANTVEGDFLYRGLAND